MRVQQNPDYYALESDGAQTGDGSWEVWLKHYVDVSFLILPFDHSSPDLQEALEKLEAHNLVSIDSDDDHEQGRDSIVATV